MDASRLVSTIDAVTVYRRGARVRRVAELSPRDGRFPEQVLLDDLPACLDDGSVSVRVEPAAAGGVVPIAYETRVGLRVADAPETREADEERQEELTAMREQEAALRERLDVLSATIEGLGGVDLPERPKPKESKEPPLSPVPAFLDLVTFFQDQHKARTAERQDVEDALQALRERIRHAERVIREGAREADLRDRQVKKTVSARLQSSDATATSARVVLEYHVPGAQWSPCYSLRVDGGTGGGELRMQALVAQATGEDWDRVALRLSTALPQRWTDLPELHGLRIGRRQAPPAPRGWREPPEGAEALYADFDASRAAQAPAAPEPAPESHDAAVAAGVARESAPEDDLGVDLEAPPSGETVDEAPPAACPAPAPMKAASRKRMMPSKALAASLQAPAMAEPPETEGAGPAGVLFDAAAPAAGPLKPADALLDYARLRMAGPASPRRGKLERAAADDAETESPEVAKALRRLVASAEAPPALPGRHVRPEPQDGFDFAYACAAPASVPSREKFQSVPVADLPVAVAVRHVAVPREAPDVFRVIRLTNPQAAPLLPGPIDLYLDGDYILTGDLKTVAPRGCVDIGFGVDPSVKIARNAAFEESSSGVLGGKLLLKHDVTIDVINNLGRTIDLEVRERVPVKREEEKEIEIHVRDVDPPWSEYVEPPESARGRHQWTLKVTAGQQRRLRAGYDVRISAKHELAGGNRREA